MDTLTDIRESCSLRIESSVEEGAARGALRGQIARLELRLASATMELWESRTGESPPRLRTAEESAARLLTLGELEIVRDTVIEQLRVTERMSQEHAQSHDRARATLEAMLAAPAGHRNEVVRRADLGEPSCGAYHVVPRLGLLGMLFGWWCVKLSSGCP